MKIPWAAAAGAYGKFARNMRLGGDREGSDFLVSHVQPIDLTRAANRVCEAAVVRQARRVIAAAE